MFNQPINQEVTVTAMYFSGQSRLKSFPKRMEWEGDTYTFRDGLQCLVKKGREMINIFDMTDGETNYRLQADEANMHWKLLTVTKC